ncbi:type II toxin-antitoxin system HicB family antitoxin [Candidatus Aerophobetes bacterium]|nr:type II toxin-antitoxin system HicB family antitoxin [Candidatus Aerophobetes bacterium]
MKREFTAIIEKRGDWYIGYVEEISGVNTQGKTIEEVRENLREALKLIMETNKSLVEKELRGKTEIIREPIVIS